MSNSPADVGIQDSDQHSCWLWGSRGPVRKPGGAEQAGLSQLSQLQAWLAPGTPVLKKPKDHSAGVGHTHHPSTWEVEVGGPEAQGVILRFRVSTEPA